MNESVNIFMRRCSVMGFRAAMVAQALWSKPQAKQEETKSLFRFVADYSLFELVMRFGEMMVVSDEVKDSFTSHPILQMLPDKFTREQLEEKAKLAGYKTPSKVILHRFIRSGFIVKRGKDDFEKVKIAF